MYWAGQAARNECGLDRLMRKEPHPSLARNPELSKQVTSHLDRHRSSLFRIGGITTSKEKCRSKQFLPKEKPWKMADDIGMPQIWRRWITGGNRTRGRAAYTSSPVWNAGLDTRETIHRLAQHNFELPQRRCCLAQAL